MAIGSGLAAQIGFADESTYGTYVAPTRFLEFEKEDLRKVKTTMQGGGLAAGRFADLGSRRVLTTVGGTGSVDLEVTNQKFGLLLNHLLGGGGTPVQQAATIAYLQTHTLADNFGSSLTVQKGVPETSGTVRPYNFLGGKVTAATFECEVMGMLTASYEFDFKNVEETSALAAASYATGLAPFHGGQLAVKIGAFGAEADINGVKKVSFKVERAQNTERFYASSAGFPATKSEPIMNDTVKITGSIEKDFVDQDLADLFADDTSTSLILEWTGPNIASTYDQLFRVTLPMTFFDSNTPGVESADISNTAYEFTVQDDGTNELITVEYMSTDTAL
jgi:hypothetical protein